jgi:hypothetical protein
MNEDFSGKRGLRINVRAYRFAVRAFIPRIAYAITILHRGRVLADPATPETLEIEKEASAIADENDWQVYRRRSGIGTYALAGLLFVLPKIGPLKLVAIKGPTAATEAEYTHSVAQSEAALRQMLSRFTPPGNARPTTGLGGTDGAKHPASAVTVQVPATNLAALPGASQDASRDLHHPLPNRDLDTGRVVQPGGYSLTDSTYAKLLHELTRQPTETIPPGIKEDILAYYANPNSPITTKKKPQQWAQVQADLVTLRKMPTSAEPAPYPTYGEDADNAK